MANTKTRRSSSSDSHRRPGEARDSHGRFKGSNILDSARGRPVAAAAAMTAVTAIAAAAGAYLWSKRSQSPSMNWGQDDEGETDSFDVAAPSGTSTASPSASAASDFAATGSAPGINPRSTNGETGLDQTVAEDTKVGSVAYGA